MDTIRRMLFAKPQIPLLDAVDSPALAAFSVRRVRRDYVGPLLRVRRSSDNAELDIPFLSSGEMDFATLMGFVGANNAYVSIWYDQSKNGYHIAQSATADQPILITSGVVSSKIGARPSVLFNGTTTWLGSDALTPLMTSAEGMFNSVFNTTSPTPNSWSKLLCYNNTPNSPGFGSLFDTNSYGVQQNFVGDLLRGNDLSINTNYIGTTKWINNSILQLTQNGAMFSMVIGNVFSGTVGSFMAGVNWIGGQSEMLVFNKNLSDAQVSKIEANQNAYYSVY